MIITQTPLRISLLGGGTDFKGFYEKYGGCVLTTALDKYIYCIVKERFDDKIYINYSEKEIVNKVSQIKHDLVREAMKITGVDKGIEISFLSDIPASGTGLGSSSSVTVGVLNALYLYQRKIVDAELLAQEACKIEVDILKRPMGIQDQYIAAYGGIRFLNFSESGVSVESVKISKERLQDFESHLMVFFTGITRESKTVLGEQKRKINENVELLKQMSVLAGKGRKLLEKESYVRLGRLLGESWRLKKKFASKVSNPKIDRMYARAIRAGAIGGKISGAGSGGFLTLIVPTNKRRTVRNSLKRYKQIPIAFSKDGSKAIFNTRR